MASAIIAEGDSLLPPILQSKFALVAVPVKLPTNPPVAVILDVLVKAPVRPPPR